MKAPIIAGSSPEEIGVVALHGNVRCKVHGLGECQLHACGDDLADQSGNICQCTAVQHVKAWRL